MPRIFQILVFTIIFCSQTFSQTNTKKLIDNSIKIMNNYFSSFLGEEYTSKYIKFCKSGSGFRDKKLKWHKLKDASKYKNTTTLILEYELIDDNDTLLSSLEYIFNDKGKCYVFDDTIAKEYRDGVEYSLTLYKNYFSNKQIIRYSDVKDILIKNGYQSDTLKIRNIWLGRNPIADSSQTDGQQKLNNYMWGAQIEGWIKRPNYAISANSKFSYGWWIYKNVYVDAFTGKILKEELMKYNDDKMPMPL